MFECIDQFDTDSSSSSSFIYKRKISIKVICKGFTKYYKYHYDSISNEKYIRNRENCILWMNVCLCGSMKRQLKWKIFSNSLYIFDSLFNHSKPISTNQHKVYVYIQNGQCEIISIFIYKNEWGILHNDEVGGWKDTWDKELSLKKKNRK